MKIKLSILFSFYLFRLIKRTNRPSATQVPNLPDCLLTRGMQPKIDSWGKNICLPPKKKEKKKNY